MKLGKFKFSFEKVDLNQIIEDVANLVRIQLQLRPSVEFILSVDPILPQEFITDAQRLKQIMINLLRNSVKFTFEGVISLTAKMTRVPDSPFKAL